MKYKILRAGEMKDLQRKVNEHLKKGWVPAGGVSVCGGYGHAHFHQAMTKAEKDRHYYECYFNMLDSNGKSIDSYVWSSPSDLSYSQAIKLAQSFAKKVAKKGIQPYYPKPSKKVSKIKFYSFKKISSDDEKYGNVIKSYPPRKYPPDIMLNAESFDAEKRKCILCKKSKGIVGDGGFETFEGKKKKGAVCSTCEYEFVNVAYEDYDLLNTQYVRGAEWDCSKCGGTGYCIEMVCTLCKGQGEGE